MWKNKLVYKLYILYLKIYWNYTGLYRTRWRSHYT